jgi:hypothetical protein
MARTVLPLAGAFVGAFFGAPQLGFAIGSVIGNAVDPQRIKGPRIGDANVQTSQEGTPRPIVYGTAAVMGNLIDRGPLNKVITEERQGKGGGPIVENESLFMTFAIRICEGPIGAVLRIWEDERLVYDIRPESEIQQDSTRYAEGFTLYLGEEDQLPDPDLETIHGVGNTPAHRGSAYIVFKEKNLTERRGSIPQFRFEVASAAEVVTRDFWEYAPIGLSATTDVAYFPKTNEYLIVRSTPGDSPKIFSSADGQAFTPVFSTDASIVTVVASPDWAVARRNNADVFTSSTGLSWSAGTTASSSSYTVGLYTGSRFLFCGFGTSAEYSAGADPSGWVSSPRPALGDAVAGVVVSNDVCVIFCINGAIHRTTDGGASWSVSSVASDLQPTRTFLCAAVDSGGLIRAYKNDAGSTWVYTSTDGGQTFDCVFYSSTFGLDVEFAGGQWITTGPSTSGGGEEVVVRVSPSGLPPFTDVPVENYPALIGQTQRRIATGGDSIFIIGTLQDGSGFVLSIGVPVTVGDGEPVPLNVVVDDISSRVELAADQTDASQLSDDLVRGLVLSGLYNGGDAVDALRKVYFFDPVEQDGKVVFVDRGAASVATITEDDLVDAPESAKRGQALEFPRKLHLDYQNAEIGYAPAKATSARSSSDVRVVGEVSIEAPVVLTSDEAAQASDKLLKTTWTEAEGEVQFSVGEEFLRLTPTDIITLNVRGTSRRLRITKIERQSGVLSITATADRISSYASSATGPVLRPPTRPPEAFAGPTTFAAMDIPALIDTNDQLGLYVGATGSSSAWAGARIQVSTDGGANWADLTDIRRSCRIGTLLDDITAALVGPVDSTNVVRVDFGPFVSEVPSFSEEQWLSERGSIAILRGDGSAEIMQYRDAVAAGGSSSSSSSDAGIWTLSPLIRGRLNSGATAHTAGATVVYLEDAAFIEVSATLLNRELTFRAVSFGETPEGSSFEQSFTFVGRSQIEFPVLDLVIEEDSLGTITASWTRRDRFGTDTAPILSTNWQGYRVTFTGDTVESLTTVSPSISFDASGLGTSAVTVSVAQLNRITGAGPSVSEVI